MKILVVGCGAREHALVWKLAQHVDVELYNYGSTTNPGIKQLVKEIGLGKATDITAIVSWAKQRVIDIAWIGPEDPLAVGIADVLQAEGIFCIGPTQVLAQLESSKGFARALLDEYHINASPLFKTFFSVAGIEEYINNILNGQCVVKPDGLTGGKGVKIMGEQLQTVNDAVEYCKELFSKGDKQVVLEEKLIGQEFSLMSLSDGTHVIHLPVVQDHKRLGVDDTGPNTGGMGSYSMSNHRLPFITEQDVQQAKTINEQTLQAIQDKYKQAYKGVLYGGFMAVKNGVKLIEYNVRFGDPEIMNLMMILNTDLVKITEAIMNGTLNKINVSFQAKASVCKYLVPQGYPEKPCKDQLINVTEVDTDKVQVFYGSVDKTAQGLIEKGSRTVALVGAADNLVTAEQMVEQEIKKITGPLIHRSDIGTAKLINQRVNMMQRLRN
ncbi:MAG: phosphoribosylamine--glycine ligase [Patescibacteria group bacterium]|jgi:fusion protein PurCD